MGPYYDYTLGYRTKGELDYWMAKCPVKTYEDTLRTNSILNEEEMFQIQKLIEQEVMESVLFAKESPFPEEAELFKDLY